VPTNASGDKCIDLRSRSDDDSSREHHEHLHRLGNAVYEYEEVVGSSRGLAHSESRQGGSIVGKENVQEDCGNNYSGISSNTVAITTSTPSTGEACTHKADTNHTVSAKASSGKPSDSCSRSDDDSSHEHHDHSCRPGDASCEYKKTMESSCGLDDNVSHQGAPIDFVRDCECCEGTEEPRTKPKRASIRWSNVNRQGQGAERFVKRMTKRVALWSAGDECAVKRAADAVENMPPETWRYCCPIPGCGWIFPTADILSIHLNWTERGPHQRYYQHQGLVDKSNQKMTDIFAEEKRKLMASTSAHIHKTPNEFKRDLLSGELSHAPELISQRSGKSASSKLRRNKKKKNNKKDLRLIGLVTVWSGGDKGAAKRGTEAIEQISRKKFRFKCPVPTCHEKFPTQEIRDLHVIGMMENHHEQYRREEGPHYRRLLSVIASAEEPSTFSSSETQIAALHQTGQSDQCSFSKYGSATLCRSTRKYIASQDQKFRQSYQQSVAMRFLWASKQTIAQQQNASTPTFATESALPVDGGLSPQSFARGDTEPIHSKKRSSVQTNSYGSPNIAPGALKPLLGEENNLQTEPKEKPRQNDKKRKRKEKVDKKRTAEAIELAGSNFKCLKLPMNDRARSKKNEKIRLEEEKEELIERVKLWSGNDENAVCRAREAIGNLKEWQPKTFDYHCPVSNCKGIFPTQEILDWHINGVGNKKHKAYRQRRSAANQQLQDNANHATLPMARYVNGVENNNHKAHRQQRGATNQQLQDNANPLTLPHKCTLIIDTCCLVGDNGAEAQRLIQLANRQQQNVGFEAAGVDGCIDMVIPYKVWAELEHQSKSGGNIAFAARAVIRMLRDTLESNIVAEAGNKKRNVLRSQTLMESREAATKFLPKDFLQSTNDDHILACALLENDHAHRKLATFRKVEVILVTQDNNLACKAYSNGLKVDSLFKFREKYQRVSSRQSHIPSIFDSASGNKTVTAPLSNNEKTEVIDLLSDSSDDEVEIIDLTNAGALTKTPKYQAMSRTAFCDEVQIVELPNATGLKSGTAESVVRGRDEQQGKKSNEEKRALVPKFRL